MNEIVEHPKCVFSKRPFKGFTSNYIIGHSAIKGKEKRKKEKEKERVSTLEGERRERGE